MENKQRKVENGRLLFDEYQKKKHIETHARSGDYFSTLVDSGDGGAHGVLASDRSTHGADKEKMDAATLQKRTNQFSSLNATIKQLHNELSEKNEMISSLDAQIRVLREGTGDHASLSVMEADKKMIRELQTMVDARDTYINQLSDSLQKRSEELGVLLNKEQELSSEILALQQEVINKTNQSETKLAESYSETLEYKAKVNKLTSQIQEYADMVNSLRTSLENSSKIHEKQEKYKHETSEEIKKLMRQVEELNHDVDKKEKELMKYKREVESLRNEQEERFGENIVTLKAELEKKYKEDVEKVELLYDGMLLEHIRKSDIELNALKNCSDLEAQMSLCRNSYEEEVNAYKGEIKMLLEKNKSAEEKLLHELNKYKQEADHYRQQVENFENKLSEEEERIKWECYHKLNKYETELKEIKANYNQEKTKCYQEEIERLSEKLKMYAMTEAKKEVELETCKYELKKSVDYINELVENLETSKEANEQLERELKQYKTSNFNQSETLLEFENKEQKLLQELKMTKAKLNEYEQEVYSFNEKIKFDSNQFSEKYNNVVQTFEEQIQNLMGELERNKAFYENDILRWTCQANEQQNEIKNLEAKLTYVLRCNNKEMASSAVVNKEISHGESNKEFLLGILSGLRDIKAYIHTVVRANAENIIENIPILQQEGIADNLSYEDLTQELNKTICDLLHIAQSMHLSEDGHVSFDFSIQDLNLKYSSQNIITSTPNVKSHYTKIESVTENNQPIHYDVTINSWMRKCARLENENGHLTKDRELLIANLKEMEYCLVVASQESKSFNEKCQVLDAKITELEGSKLSEYMLKKENNELKEKLAHMEEAEGRFSKELEVLNENNIKLEEMFNKNILDLHSKMTESETNVELENILTDLKQKSEEVIFLKTQLVSLQKSERVQKQNVIDLQAKYKQVIAKHEFLSGELKTKHKELEEILKEKNKVSLENKLLHTKLLSQEKINIHTLNIPNAMENSMDYDQIKHDKRDVATEKDTFSLPDCLENLSVSRLQTLQELANHHLAEGKHFSTSMTVAEQINYELQLLEQEEEYYMPTIPEEEVLEEESPCYRQTALNHLPQVESCFQGKAKRIPHRMSSLVKCRSILVLRQLLSVLFDEYTSCIKKLLLPWKEELGTLDFNVHKELDKHINNKCTNDGKKTEMICNNCEKEPQNRLNTVLLSQDSLKLITDDCLKSLFFLKRKLIVAHNSVLKYINVQKEQIEKGCLLVELQEQVANLQAEKSELEKKQKSAIELLIKDHDNELNLVNSLLTKVQKVEPVRIIFDGEEALRKDLEQKHKKEVEELRTYFEKKCADLEKHYSEEIYSQSQQSCKVSVSSCSSDVENMVDLFYTPVPDYEEPPHLTNEEKLHDGCEKSITDFKELLKNMQEKYKAELASVMSECDVRLSESICKMCRKNDLLIGEDDRRKEAKTAIDQYYVAKICELGSRHSTSSVNKDLELKVYQIKEEVRKDYDNELDKIREEIITNELKRKDMEINTIKAELNEAHRVEVEKLWQRFDELANKEVENSVIRVKNEVILSQELEDKGKLIEGLKNDKKELSRKQKKLMEEKEQEMEQLKNDLIEAHKKELGNVKQAFELELTTRIETVLEEKAEMEDNLKKQIERLQEVINTIYSEKDDWQECQKQEVQQLTNSIRKDILCALEQQIKAVVVSGEEGQDMPQLPPIMATLERQFTAKYQRQFAQLVEEHALEIADIKAEYDAKLRNIVKEYSMKQAEEITEKMPSTGDQDLDKIIRERDNLRGLALTLRQVVKELAGYLTSCEEELNLSIVGELLKLASPHSTPHYQVQISAVEGEGDSSDTDRELSLVPQKKVHFAPDVSSIVSLMDEEYLFDCLENSVDVSVHFRSELEACLERLRGEAAAVLGLTKVKERGLPLTVEDRRLSSLTRQLIEEKKAKEEANGQLQHLQKLVNKYEKELNDVHKELMETNDRMIKEKVAAETELEERQADRRLQKLCLLQEKARSLLSEKGDCPPLWLGLIEELCVEGDSLIDEARRASSDLKLEIEAADKQLRSTRAFLEEQASEREQERDEFTREISRLTELLREREKKWTSHKHFASEVETLDEQVKETTEMLKETEEKKLKAEKELKAAVDKVWVLRDIISDLEAQVCSGSEREDMLKVQVSDLKAELQQLSRAHADLLQELQALRECGNTHALQQELCSLQDQLKIQGSPLLLRQIKSQLRSMAKTLDRQIKELEAVNIHVSSASLSSPSEDVSIREQLEALRCLTPETGGCPGSPPSPQPVEEVSQLSDRLLRYSRAAENIIKKLRDRDIEINMLRQQTEELQAERDVLAALSDKQLGQLASLHGKVEELRARGERELKASAAPLQLRIRELEENNKVLSDHLSDSQKKLGKMQLKLERSEALVLSQETELSSVSLHQQDLVLKLGQDLDTMRAEKQTLQAMVEKYRTEDNVSFPQLIEVMLAEKNADIDQLQIRVEELQTQQDQQSWKGGSQQSRSRTCRVSFADDLLQSPSRLTEGERARDTPHHEASIKPYFSTPLSAIEEGGTLLIPRVIGEDISKIAEPVMTSLITSPNRAAQLESVLSQLKSELDHKTQRLLECEAQLQDLPALKEELRKIKEELLETVKSVSEDKLFYENQLKNLGETQQLLTVREEELKRVQEELTQKEEDIVKTTADVRALQLIMEGLQQKLQEAKSFAEHHENNTATNNQQQELKMTNEKYKEECEAHKCKIVRLEKQVGDLKKAVHDEKEIQETLRDTIGRLEKEKQDIISELVTTKSNCEALEKKLEKALTSVKENRDRIESLQTDLDNSLQENKKLNTTCQKLKKEVEHLTKKQKTDLKNVVKKDSEEALKMREEIKGLKSSNSELQSACDSLQQELDEVGNNLELLNQLNSKDDKIEQLESELKQLDVDNKTLEDEKKQTEQSLSTEISVLKLLIDDLNKNIVTLETESKDSQDNLHSREQRETLVRKYEMLKREYERQRRARRESEKKCSILKDELTKEKRFSAHLQNGTAEKQKPKLVVMKASIVDIRSDGIQLANSLDSLTDEVQKELNTSAQLDQSLIAGLQKSEPATGTTARSENMPGRVEHLTSRLVEVETALHTEQLIVSELRNRLAQQHARYLAEHARAADLSREVAALHTLTDQFQDKFQSIAYQLEQQVSEVKELRCNMEPDGASLQEKEKLKKSVEEYQRRVEELLQERVFNNNQVLYLRQELAKLASERQGHGHGDNRKAIALESVNEKLVEKQERQVGLQRALEEANMELEMKRKQQVEASAQAKALCSTVEDLKKQLNVEVDLRKSLETKIKAVEMAEKSRHSRRKAAEEKMKESLVQAEKVKKDLERECLGLQLKLKQSHLQLTSYTTESPLSIRLLEANMAVERLVCEKEDLNSANILLVEEKEDLQRKLMEKEGVIEVLNSRIHTLNIKVTDGGVDNLNAMFAAERAAWLQEKEKLRHALTQIQSHSNTDSFNGYSNSAHILQKFLRAESHRKALVWQKRYLMVALRCYQDEEWRTVETLSARGPAPLFPPPQPSPISRFRVAACVVRAVSRLQFLVEHRRRAHENTCRLLQRALNSNKLPQPADKVPELQTLWRKNVIISSSSSLGPGSLSAYVDRFNSSQDRIKNLLSSES